MTSAPSGPSLRYGWNAPSESPRPRTSAMDRHVAGPGEGGRRAATAARPLAVRRADHHRGRGQRWAARSRSADSVMPSRSGIRTLNLRSTPASATTPDATRGPVSLSGQRRPRRSAPARPVAAAGRAVAGGIGAAGREGPLLEPGAAAVLAEPDDPQIAVFLAEWVPVATPARTTAGARHGEDSWPGEDRDRDIPALLPHPPDRVQAGQLVVE